MKKFLIVALIILLIPAYSTSECIYHENPVKYYENSANKYSITILAIHGGRESRERAKRYCEEISGIFTDSKVYSLDFDLKGEREDFGKSAIVSAVKLARYIKDSNKKFVIIGTSFGGFLAWKTATIVQPDKLIMVSGFTRIDKMYETAKKHPEKYGEWLELVKGIENNDLMKLLKELSANSSDIKSEVLILHGLKDDTVPFEMVLEDIKSVGGKWYILLNSDGHPVDLENPTIRTILKDFVDR